MNIYEKKFSVYVLELEDGKWYVGRTANELPRLESHFSGSGSQFTRKHKPIRIAEIHRDCDRFDEEKYLYMNMHVHGIDNVRGGSFSSEHLSASDRKFITKVITNAIDACFLCGKSGHFASACPGPQKVIVIDDDDYEDIDEDCYVIVECTRCGRTMHEADTCPYKKHKNGKKIQTNKHE